jgi:hypothetical protein
VRKGADIRVIPPQDGANDAFDHLMKLGPSAHLISWLNGFVSGEAEQALSWDHNLAASSWVRMSRNNSVYVGPASRSTESRSHGVGRAREVPVNVAEVLQYSTAQIRALLVPTLRAILGALGVRNTGNKAVLIDALLTYQRNRGQGPGGQNDRGSADSAEQQGMETERHSEQNRDASSVQVSRPQSTYIMPPRQVFRVDPCPGGLPIVSMGTLSWFWVPVIAHAMNIQGVPALPPDAVLYQLGAVFSLAGLVDVVRRFIQLGQYNVHLQEIQNRQGYLVYFVASAQDRLHQLLLASPIPSPVNVLGNYISNWFDHLYAQNMRRISQPGSPNAISALAYHWGPHHALQPNGQTILIQGSHVPGGLPMIPVWLEPL